MPEETPSTPRSDKTLREIKAETIERSRTITRELKQLREQKQEIQAQIRELVVEQRQATRLVKALEPRKSDQA